MSKEKTPKNEMKPGWEIAFLAENLFVQVMALKVHETDGRVTERCVEDIATDCIRVAKHFNTVKHRLGYVDLVTDKIGDDNV